MTFGLVEKVVHTVLVNNVAVDTRLLVGGQEERLRLALEVGEIIVGIGVVYNIGTVAVFHRPVNEILSSLVVIDCLRRPHSLKLFLIVITLLHIHYRALPIYKVVTLQQHHGAVGVPAVARNHVGKNHVECFSVGTAQNVGIAHAACRADDL